MIERSRREPMVCRCNSVGARAPIVAENDQSSLEPKVKDVFTHTYPSPPKPLRPSMDPSPPLSP
jgi:hypothetical protein